MSRHGAWRSLVSALVWGTRGPEFESRRPDQVFMRDCGLQAAFSFGVPIRDEAVLELARLVDDPALADRLETAYGRETKVLALTIPERSTILAALEDPPADLAELRGVLLRELAWLRSEGLA